MSPERVSEVSDEFLRSLFFGDERPHFVAVIRFVPYEMTPQFQERFLRWREVNAQMNCNAMGLLENLGADENPELRDRVAGGTPGIWEVRVVSGPECIDDHTFNYPICVRVDSSLEHCECFGLECVDRDSPIFLEEEGTSWYELVVGRFVYELYNQDILDFDLNLWREFGDRCDFISTMRNGLSNEPT